ncbi:hypothetical protein [Alteromonas oceanisediminis]|uniref:hypothetical protein n=1 Tax=Alteromonas oceanisediminis TaxID=2836180 RepID=UPI001BD94F75|nr:hypothetical protein [Alteromonas oceanisediminis]MBT0588172.1 hypothetical protein [Alteromonas oceanisediminis]
MKFFYLSVFALLLGCTPADYVLVENTEYVGVASDKQSAISAVRNVIEKQGKPLPCRDQSFSAFEIQSRSKFKEVRLGKEIKRTNYITVIEWGIEEIIFNPDTTTKFSRFWSVNGKNGNVKLVGNKDWKDSFEPCSVSSKNA